MTKDKVFVKISNHDIYMRIEGIEQKIETVIQKLDYTNGKVKKSLVIAGGAMGLAVLVLSFFIEHLFR